MELSCRESCQELPRCFLCIHLHFFFFSAFLVHEGDMAILVSIITLLVVAECHCLVIPEEKSINNEIPHADSSAVALYHNSHSNITFVSGKRSHAKRSTSIVLPFLFSYVRTSLTKQLVQKSIDFLLTFLLSSGFGYFMHWPSTPFFDALSSYLSKQVESFAFQFVTNLLALAFTNLRMIFV